MNTTTALTSQCVSKSILLLAAACGLLATSHQLHAQAIVNNTFETAADMTSYIQSNVAGTNVTALEQAAGIGTGGTGGVRFITGTSESDITAINGTSLNLTGGTTYTFSTDYHKIFASNLTTLFQVGFFTDNNVSTGSSNRYINFRVVGQTVTGAANTCQLQLVNRDNAASGGTALGSNFTLLDNNTDWYRLSGTLTLTDPVTKTFSYTVSLWNIGSTGITDPILIQSASGTLVNAILAADSSLWYGFRELKGVASAADNVSAVPEPHSAALLGMALLLLGLGKYRTVRQIAVRR